MLSMTASKHDSCTSFLHYIKCGIRNMDYTKAMRHFLVSTIDAIEALANAKHLASP